jgi:ATP-binding cassette, sub-family E, member 1
MTSKRAAFVVEHDFIMATYMADKVIVFDGEPAKDTFCTAPESMVSGMNRFLKMMDITFRRDPNNYRPRINKHNSVKDCEQKKAGNYFLMEESTAALKRKKKETQEEEKEEEAEHSEETKEEIKEYEKIVK